MKISISHLISGFIFVLMGLVASPIVLAQTLDAVWDGTTGTWSDASKWSTANYPDNGNGGFNYNALIGSGNVTVDLNPTVKALFLSGGNLYFNSTTLTANDLFIWSGGILDGGVTNADGGLVLSGSAKYLVNGHVLNYDGVVNWTGGNINLDNTVLNYVSTATLETNFDGQIFSNFSDGVFENAGTFTKSGGVGTTYIFRPEFNSSGVVNVDSGTLSLYGGEGTMTGPFNIAAGTTLEIYGTYDFDTGSSITGDGNVVIDGSSVIFTGGAISPGSWIGTLSFDGITKIVDGSALEIDLKATSGTPGTDWDFIDVTGTLDFDDDVLPSGVTVEGNQLLLNYLSQVAFINATDLRVLRGFIVDGTLEDTYESDDVYLQYNPGIRLNSSESPVWLEFEGTLCSDTPPSLGFTLEAHTSSVGIGQTIELFNYSSGVYEMLDSRNATIVDSALYFEAEGDVTRFVESGIGKVKTRLAWNANGPVAQYPWTVSIDQVLWTLSPK